MDATGSAILLNDYKLMVDNYTSILEKTNSQLNMWINPYGLIISVLTILITLIAIGVSFALWKNSKEQKDRTERFFIEQEKNSENFRKEKDKEVQLAKKNLNKLIKEYQNKLLTAGKDNKKIIENAISSLRKEEAVIGAYTVSDRSFSPYAVPPGGSGGSIFFTSKEKEMICSKCGRKFRYYDQPDNHLSGGAISYVTLGPKEVYCSFCGAANLAL